MAREAQGKAGDTPAASSFLPATYKRRLFKQRTVRRCMLRVAGAVLWSKDEDGCGAAALPSVRSSSSQAPTMAVFSSLKRVKKVPYHVLFLFGK
jgi:hypothetical protein